MAIVFLAPTEKYFAALGPFSLSDTEPPHPTSKEKSKKCKYLLRIQIKDVLVAQW